MKRVLWIERDGGLFRPYGNTEVLLPELHTGVITALAAIARHTSVEVVLLESAVEPSTGVESVPALLKHVFRAEGIHMSEMPVAALLAKTSEDFVAFDRARSLVVGVNRDLLDGAARLGLPTLALSADSAGGVDWGAVRERVIAAERRASMERVTKETSIVVDLSLYGSDHVVVDTGLGFFDHMLDLFFTHAGFDARLKAVGDLHVDEHHLVEDVGITIGEALRTAIGDKRGMSRYGFLLPMDESLASIAIDLAGRAAFEWKAEFRREKIGDVATEMFAHFFKSLSDGLRCALHISVEGENEHHKAEAIFKGVGRTLRQAVTPDPRQMSVPSTKGVL